MYLLPALFKQDMTQLFEKTSFVNITEKLVNTNDNYLKPEITDISNSNFNRTNPEGNNPSGFWAQNPEQEQITVKTEKQFCSLHLFFTNNNRRETLVSSLIDSINQ